MTAPADRVRFTLPRWAAALLVFAAALAYFFSFHRYAVNAFDEGVLLEAVRLHDEGRMDLPRFSHFYVEYKLLAWALPFTEGGLTGARQIWAIARALTAMLLFLVAGRLVPQRWALLTVLLFAVLPGPWHKSLAPLIIALNLFLLLRARESGRTRDALALAAALGFGVAMLVYNGLLTAVGCAAAVAVAGPREAQPAPTSQRRIGVTAFIGVFAGVAWLLAPELFLVDPRFFIEQTWAVLRSDHLGSRVFARQDFGLASGRAALLALAAYAATIAAFVSTAPWAFGKRRRQLDAPARFAAQAAWLLAAANLLKWFARFDLAHLLQNAAPVWLLLTFALRQAARRWRESFGQRIAAMALAALPACVLGLGIASGDYYVGGPGARWFGNEAPLRVGASTMFAERSQAATLARLDEAIRRRTAPDDAIVVAAPAPLLYAMTGRRNPLALAIFDRPENLMAYGEDGVIRDIRAANVKLIVLRDEATDGVERNRLSRYAPALYRLIVDGYELAEEIDGYQLRVRRASAEQSP